MQISSREIDHVAAASWRRGDRSLAGCNSAAQAQHSRQRRRRVKPGANTSFGPLKQIDAGVLNVGYAEAGPADGPPVILLHGWPYDIHSFVDVAPLLASAGYRVIVPYLRGYGTTRFLSSDTVRNGQPSALAVDVIALMDALKIEKAILAGFDWGARTANIVAALWPERCKALVVGERLSDRQPGGRQDAAAAQGRARSGGTSSTSPPSAAAPATTNTGATSRSSSGRSPRRKWQFDDATFDRSAAAFDNPDHVDIVIHNYRWRLGLAEGEPKYDDLEKRLAAGPGHRRADHHPRRRRQRRAASGAQRLRQEVLRQVRAPADHRRHRAQPAAGSAAGLRPGRHRRRRSLIEFRHGRSRRDNNSKRNGAMSQTAKVLYTAKTHTTGGRENGASRSSDGHLDVRLSTPGSARIGTNPEQLFAAGWSACFESAIALAARKRKITLPADVAIDAEVDLNLADSGYFLSARLNVSLPGVERDIAQALVDEAHQICPYSKATRGNIDVAIKLV